MPAAEGERDLIEQVFQGEQTDTVMKEIKRPDNSKLLCVYCLH